MFECFTPEKTFCKGDAKFLLYQIEQFFYNKMLLRKKKIQINRMSMREIVIGDYPFTSCRCLLTLFYRVAVY